jgi:hypothetical protein
MVDVLVGYVGDEGRHRHNTVRLVHVVLKDLVDPEGIKNVARHDVVRDILESLGHDRFPAGVSRRIPGVDWGGRPPLLSASSSGSYIGDWSSHDDPDSTRGPYCADPRSERIDEDGPVGRLL